MGWKIFREIARPFEDVAHGIGLSAGGATRPDTVFREARRIYRQPQVFTSRTSYLAMKKLTGSEKNAAGFSRMFSVSTSALGGDPLPFKPVSAEESGSSNPTLFRKGRQGGDWLGSIIGTFIVGGAVLGGGAAAGEGGGTAAVEAAGVVGEQEGAIAGLSAAGAESAPAMTGLELEAAAGSMTATEGFEGAGSSFWPAVKTAAQSAVTGAAAATVSSMLTKAVNAVINPLFPKNAEAGTTGGGGGGSAGGYPFPSPLGDESGDSTQLYLIAAALAALLIVAAKKKAGGG